MCIKQIILFITALLILPAVSYAQSFDIQKARDAYREGRIKELTPHLGDYIRKLTSNKKANKPLIIEGYKILTNSYLYLNEKDSAEKAMLNLLRYDPEHEVKPDNTFDDSTEVDSPEFINLYNSFRTRPIFLIGGKAGGNLVAGASLAGVNESRNFSVDNSNISNREYSNKLGYQVGISAEIPIYKQFSLNPELYVSGKNYHYKTDKQKLLNFANITFLEKQTWVELPILLKYNFNIRKNRIPFINIGASVNYLLKSGVELTRKDTIENGNNSFDDNIKNISAQRNRINYSAIIGGGIKLKDILGKGYLIIEARYMYGLRNLVNADNRASNPVLIYDFLHIDNDFTLNSFVLSVGYIIPYYKPKLLKKSSNL